MRSIFHLAIILALTPASLAGNLVAQNHCDFDIWCSGARKSPGPNKPGESSPIVYVPAGTRYTSTLPAENNNMGATLKCSRDAANLNPLQSEIAVQQGRWWYGLSAVDGDPFIDAYRHVEIPGRGRTPIQYGFYSTADIVLTLCYSTALTSDGVIVVE
ncbi:hypothetical protein F5Y15DRAFT_414207 [Xylariaceae sp. FL0016]|nr:hypothetical protein F5Y15DRAFT_414207 [Xylariaceae sp. FL0016]